jgi:hypothetical protein
MGERDSKGFSVESPERKRPIGRRRGRWEGNIKIYLRDIGWCVTDWTYLSQCRDQWRAFVSTVMNLCVPNNMGNS